jgi:hypothetical protein
VSVLRKHYFTSKRYRINTHDFSVTISYLLVILCHINLPLIF